LTFYLYFLGWFLEYQQESFIVCFGIEIISYFTEIKLKWEDLKQHSQTSSADPLFCDMVILKYPLNNIWNWMNKIIQNQIKSKHSWWFLRNILRINRTFFLTNCMRKIHQQGARSGCGIITSHIAHWRIHKNWGHNFSHSVRCVIFSIFPASILVVVFNKIFKDRGKEIKLLARKYLKLNSPADSQVLCKNYLAVSYLKCIGSTHQTKQFLILCLF